MTFSISSSRLGIQNELEKFPQFDCFALYLLRFFDKRSSPIGGG